MPPLPGHFILLRQQVAEVLRIEPERLADISLQIEKYEGGPDFHYLDLLDRMDKTVIRLCVSEFEKPKGEIGAGAEECEARFTIDMGSREDFMHILVGLLHEAEAEYKQRATPVILVWNELPSPDFWYLKRTAQGDAGLFLSSCSFETAWSNAAR